MPVTFANQGSLNSTTEVELQAPPVTGALLVREVFIRNADTADVVLDLYLTGGISIWKGTLNPGDVLQMSNGDVIVLNTSTGLYAKLDGAPATTQPTYAIGMVYDTSASV